MKKHEKDLAMYFWYLKSQRVQEEYLQLVQFEAIQDIKWIMDHENITLSLKI